MRQNLENLHTMKTIINLLLITILFFITSCEDEKTIGCTDSLACNYNSEATEENNTCEYSQQGFDCDGNITSEIGDVMEGGYLFYIDETGQHGLIAALEDIDGVYEWGCYLENVNGSDETSIGTGYQNTMDIINQGCISYSGGITAAEAALNYQSQSYNDWFLPSKDELLELYFTIGNGGSSVVNGEFYNSHWSSSEANSYNSWYVLFNEGAVSSDKADNDRVRPIRAF